MKNIVVVDIDGTIANIGDRVKFLKQEPKDYDSFYASCFDDEPIKEMCKLVYNLWMTGYEIVFLTGRRDSVRSITNKWIIKHIFNDLEFFAPYDGFDRVQLYMRPAKDHRKDEVVKLEQFKNAGYKVEDIAFVLEDRTKMVKMWRNLGVRCLQVADGNF